MCTTCCNNRKLYIFFHTVYLRVLKDSHNKHFFIPLFPVMLSRCSNILIHIQRDATLHTLFYTETTLHISGRTTTHHQERKQLYLQNLVFARPFTATCRYLKMPRPRSGAHAASSSIGICAFQPGGKMAEVRETFHLPPLSAEVKNKWRYTFTSPYTFIALKKAF